MIKSIIFYTFAILSFGSAVMVVFLKRPIYSVISLILTMFGLSGLYFMLDAYLIGAIQIIVYAGAVMVLFLFVVMLLNLGKEHASSFRTGPSRWFAIPLAIFLLTEIYMVLRIWPKQIENHPVSGSIEEIGKLIFTTYLLPFEIVSFLLLAAILGTTVLAKRKWK
ncbi:MAG: NADH-quinone oxidoreductase subunit J [Chlamydiota bacterium]|nr:NADH-quinone oxidoreductase subunit J [Chlamydiota bacterium]